MNQPQENTVARTLLDVVSSLQRFWVEQGCVMLAPCDFEVPFATLHPEAFFNLLGSTPWQAAYLQPVRRRLDGRYGLHPYRLSRHHQFEVILKPPLADIQSLYLASLEAVGLELQHHDLHFAEWKWQPRSLGVEGAGWHAVVDGLGVTRMTFLERVADRSLDPVGVEISYGLERLMMLLQGVASVFDVDGSEGGRDRSLRQRRDEEEISRYVFEVADVADLRSRLQALDLDAERCLAVGLARPAYELAVRCLELIDTLEARGDVSQRERSSLLDRVRERVVAAAELDLERDPAPQDTSSGEVGQRRPPRQPESNAAPEVPSSSEAPSSSAAPSSPDDQSSVAIAPDASGPKSGTVESQPGNKSKSKRVARKAGRAAKNRKKPD